MLYSIVHGPASSQSIVLCRATTTINTRRNQLAIVQFRTLCIGWLGSRVVSVLDSGAEGPGSIRSRDAVG